MKANLAFDFLVDKQSNSIQITREFDAPLALVWDAYTKPELLDQWWAPKPWKARTKSMDFREGGKWHYAMVGPAGEEHWAMASFITIRNQKQYTGTDAFADAAGVVNKDMPQSKWDVKFSSSSESTTVNFQITFDDLAQLETTIQMGFKEGITMAMEGLDALLPKWKVNLDAVKVTIQASVNAPASKVWAYYTEPKHITQWNFAHPSWHCPHAENNMQIGGKYLARMEARDGSFGFDFEAIYLALEMGKMFRYEMPNGRQAQVSFEGIGTQTNVTVVFDAENEHPVDMQRDGWQSILDNFKAYAETH